MMLVRLLRTKTATPFRCDNTTLVSLIRELGIDCLYDVVMDPSAPPVISEADTLEDWAAADRTEPEHGLVNYHAFQA